jgi:hypothetical protein
VALPFGVIGTVFVGASRFGTVCHWICMSLKPAVDG